LFPRDFPHVFQADQPQQTVSFDDRERALVGSHDLIIDQLTNRYIGRNCLWLGAHQPGDWHAFKQVFDHYLLITLRGGIVQEPADKSQP
jgi:hypothetical protein